DLGPRSGLVLGLVLRGRMGRVADLDRGPVRVRAVFVFGLQRPGDVALDLLPRDRLAPGGQRRDLLDRLRAEIERAVQALGAFVDDAHDDVPLRAGDVEARAAPRGVVVVDRVHRGDVQIV